MIRNLKFSCGYQGIQYINALLMGPEFGLMVNLMSQMMSKLSQILKLSKGDPATHTMTKEITVPYKAEFMQAMIQEIK